MIDSQPLGIVVIGRNEGERLRRCLLSIPPTVPVVYVDSASTDDSVEFARTRGAEIVQLDSSWPFTAARARNEGCQRLLAMIPHLTYVQFVDGDCELEDGWLQAAQVFLESHPDVAVVCGRRRERHPDQSFYNKLCDDEWNTPVGEAEASGGDAIARVSAFTAAGGYDSGLIAGEEPELCSRLRQLRWVVWRVGVPMTIHDAAMHSFGQWWQRAVRSGYGYAQVWHTTKRASGNAVFGRELGRAVMWALGVPAAAVVAALVWGPVALLLAPLVWGAQLIRLSARYGAVKGAHLLVAKAAECLGAARYVLALGLRRQKSPIYYK